MYNRLQFIRWTVTWTTSTVVLGPCYEFVVYVWFELIIGAGGSCYVWLLSFESSVTDRSANYYYENSSLIIWHDYVPVSRLIRLVLVGISYESRTLNS